MTEKMMDYMTLADNKEIVLNAVQQALKLKVRNLHDFELGGEISASLKKMEKEISAYWKESVESAKTSYDTQRNLRDADLSPVQEARKQIDQLCGEWKTEEDRNTRAEQERLERQAKEKADQQRQKLLKKAQEEQDEKKKEKLLEKAELVVEKPVFAAKTIEKTTTLAGGGIRSWISDINVEVVDAKAVCKAVADGNIPITCVEFKNLKAWAKLNNFKADMFGLKITEISRPSTRI